MKLVIADLSESGTTPTPRTALRLITERRSRSNGAMPRKRGLARDRAARPAARRVAMKAATTHSQKLMCTGAGSDPLRGTYFGPAGGSAGGHPIRVQTPHEGARPCVPGPGGTR